LKKIESFLHPIANSKLNCHPRARSGGWLGLIANVLHLWTDSGTIALTIWCEKKPNSNLRQILLESKLQLVSDYYWECWRK